MSSDMMSMIDFGLGNLEVNEGTTAEFEVPGIRTGGKRPTLIVRPASEINRPYFSSALRKASKNVKRVQTHGIEVEDVKAARDEDRRLFPMHVIVGWKDLCNANKVPVPFSKAACAQFVSQLPDWLFDELRNFCSDVSNFIQAGDEGPTAEAIEELAGN